MFTGVLRVFSFVHFYRIPHTAAEHVTKWPPRLERFHNGRWQLRFGDEVLSLAPEALDVRPDPQAHKDRSDASSGRSHS